MALAIHLPGDGRVLGAHLVTALRSSGGSSVHGDIHTHVAIDDHSAEEIRVVVHFIIDNGEDLRLDTDLLVGSSENTVLVSGEVQDFGVTEDTVVERSLVLVGGSASSGSRVGPVNFVGLSDHHVDAVLPFVGLGELGILCVVLVATEARVNTSVDEDLLARTSSILVVLSNRKMLSTQVPVDIDRAHSVHPVRGSDRIMFNLHLSTVSLGDVGSSLGSDGGVGDSIEDALDVGYVGVGPSTGVLARAESLNGVGDIVNSFSVLSAVSGAGSGGDSSTNVDVDFGRGVAVLGLEGNQRSHLSDDDDGADSNHQQEDGHGSSILEVSDRPLDLCIGIIM